MIIPINFSSDALLNPKLPPFLAKISHDELLLIELQGSIEIEPKNSKGGQKVGILTIDEALVGSLLCFVPITTR
jgi:chromosome transmission fidelity protein 8